MQVIDFFRLDRSVQDRFIEAARGVVPPAPLAFQRARPNPRVFVWWAAAACATMAAGGLLSLGFGQLEAERALLSPPYMLLIGAFVACAVFCALRAVAVDQVREGLPYRAGVYVFPIGVVDAQNRALSVRRWSQLVSATQAGATVVLSFEDGARYPIELVDAGLAAQLLQSIELHRQRVSGEFGPPSSRDLAALDPLADTGFKNPLASTEPLSSRTPAALRYAPLLAIALGLVAGPLLWKLRNFLSEERIYAQARASGSSAAYRTYLARGGTRAEVAGVLLPRAELADAIARGDVSALEAFLRRTQSAEVRGEAQAALRKALLAELETVAKRGSLAGLLEFERAQPHQKLVARELELKKSELYHRAARSFASAANPQTPGLVGFFGRLLFHAQKHGPKVEIRFRRRAAESSERAEAQLQKSAYYLGPESLPSRYFRPEAWEPREAELSVQIAERLNREFQPDILHFEPAAVLDDDGKDPARVSSAALVITHRTEMSGAYMSKSPPGAFVGLGLMVRAEIVIPGDAQPLEFKHSAWLPPDLKRWEQPGTKPRDIYEGLARDGLSRFKDKYLNFLFKAP
jgi:hypothetical protein